MTNKFFLLFLHYSLVCQYVAASPKRPTTIATIGVTLHQLRGGQDQQAEIHILPTLPLDRTPAPTAEEQSLPSGLTFLPSTTPKRTSLGANLQQQWTTLRSKVLLPDLATISSSKLLLVDAVGPATLAFRQLFWPSNNKRVTLPAVYALALLGASTGFFMFLYFITIGYALGVMLPVGAAIYIYNSQRSSIPALTNAHAGLVIAWAIRSATFFWHREYINWPQLHDKVVEVNKMAKISSKLFCWIIYSLFYVFLVIPCLSRLESDISWGLGGKVALGVQATGFLLETVADFQKSTFKSIPGNRNQWCHVGIWKFSTHPNYLGELLFWYGTYFAGMAAYQKPYQWILATFGILFITLVLKGAVSSLGMKHVRKYSNNSNFVQFRKSHTLFGPNPLAKSI